MNEDRLFFLGLWILAFTIFGLSELFVQRGLENSCLTKWEGSGYNVKYEDRRYVEVKGEWVIEEQVEK